MERFRYFKIISIDSVSANSSVGIYAEIPKFYSICLRLYFHPASVPTFAQNKRSIELSIN